MTFPPALPHGSIQKAFDDVFYVQGSFRMAPLLTITRNMIILRSEGELTLINSVRLTKAGEQALAALGEVKHLMKIGAFHGADDPYYIDRYKPTYWSLPKAKHAQNISPDKEMTKDTRLPFPGASLFRFENARFPEAALLLPIEGGTLITCDSVQNWTSLEGLSLVGKLVTRAMGFLQPAWIGRPWRKTMTRKEGPPLVDDFRKLLELPFQNLISGHGTPLVKTAKDDLARTVAHLFGG